MATLTAEQIKDAVIEALDVLKGRDIVAIDVRRLTGLTDYMIICSGTSNRHVKSLADNAMEKLKKLGCRILGSEGEGDAEWVLVDFGDVVVHVMLPETRTFYDLERLWNMPAQVADEN